MPCFCLAIDQSGTRGAAECITDVLPTFWYPLWSITVQTHSNTEAARSSDILKTLITMFSFHNVWVERAESHAPNFKFNLRFIYLHIYISHFSQHHIYFQGACSQLPNTGSHKQRKRVLSSQWAGPYRHWSTNGEPRVRSERCLSQKERSSQSDRATKKTRVAPHASKLIFFLILVTYLVDIVLILCWYCKEKFCLHHSWGLKGYRVTKQKCRK